jgi:hypothetical protein
VRGVRKEWTLWIALCAVGSMAVAGSGLGGGLTERQAHAARAVRADAKPPFGYPVRQARECATLCPGDRFPVSSPNGQRIAYMRRNRGRLDLMVMNADARDQRVVAHGFGHVRHALWSPDGQAVLLDHCGGGRSETASVTAGLCTVDADARVARDPNTVVEPPDYAYDRPLAWSPDGGHIAFLRSRSGQPYSELLTVRADGSDLVSIGGGTSDPEDYRDAAWSRNGRSMAFITMVRTGDSSKQVRKLWVADATGQGRRLVASTLDFLSIVGWAPDGKRIYLRSGGYPFSWSSVVAVDLSSGDVVTLVKRRADALGQTALSPDGTLLAFVQGRLITIANTNGRNVRVVARGVSTQVRDARGYGFGIWATTFTWSADSMQLVYVSDGLCPALLGLHSIDVASRRTHRLTQVCRIGGTAGADSLVGTETTNGIYGYAGDDRIRAGGKPDYVAGGPGDDTIDGGRSDDRLYGGPGRDRIDGGLGFDAIVANDGTKDRIECGSGRDVVWADRADEVSRHCEDVIRS